MAGITSIGSVIKDDILAGYQVPVLTTGGTVLTTQGVLARGSVLGIVTASRKYKLCDANSVDGSEVPNAILSEEVDTDSGDIVATLYKSGEFVKDKLVYGTNGAPADAVSVLRGLNIHLRDQYTQV